MGLGAAGRSPWSPWDLARRRSLRATQPLEDQAGASTPLLHSVPAVTLGAGCLPSLGEKCGEGAVLAKNAGRSAGSSPARPQPRAEGGAGRRGLCARAAHAHVGPALWAAGTRGL